ncbi:hypothetical protein FNV43_RR25405 [Rhamnella rubrinervis]|uniref:Uncharacterized protein n=1 Tax=Rhamnella rubrinervis TaxID=2594499 RepID=A0A8K0DZX4_9ROSA|nr:hypothetical protein FNV43_RR25405 [Rhamnella rubrinervis]
MVDCNGQGMLFVEVSADVKLQQLGHPIVPPFPFLDEVLYNVPGSDAIGNSFRMWRFHCRCTLTHNVWDGCGVIQFLNAVAWHKLKQLYESDIVQCSFTFTPNQINSIRKHLPQHLATTCTQFDLLTACLWKCRTLALNLDPQEVVQVLCIFSGQARKQGLNLPRGYYGNVIASPSVVSEAGVLSKKPFAYAVELLKKATSMASGEYIRSVADLLVTKKRILKLKGNFMVSDTTTLKFEELDFGWGYPEFVGVAISFPFFSFYVKYKNNGEDLIVVQISLPRVAIDKFQQELKKMIDDNHGRQIWIQSML